MITEGLSFGELSDKLSPVLQLKLVETLGENQDYWAAAAAVMHIAAKIAYSAMEEVRPQGSGIEPQTEGETVLATALASIILLGHITQTGPGHAASR